MTKEDVRALLYEAAGSAVGIRVETNQPELLRQRFYTERRSDPALEAISIHISPTNPSGELWLVNKEPDNES